MALPLPAEWPFLPCLLPVLAATLPADTMGTLTAFADHIAAYASPGPAAAGACALCRGLGVVSVPTPPPPRQSRPTSSCLDPFPSHPPPPPHPQTHVLHVQVTAMALRPPTLLWSRPSRCPERQAPRR